MHFHLSYSSFVRKPKTQRGKRILKQREPKVVEDGRSSLFMTGPNSNEFVKLILRDLCSLRKPDSLFLKARKPLHVIDDETSVEKFCLKTGSSNFVAGSHSKKRPCNLTFGRLFDGQVLDAVEFKVTDFKLAFEFESGGVALGTKPCVLINGSEFQTDPNLNRVGNILSEFFKGKDVQKVRLAGLEHLISISYVNGLILIRSYRVLLKKSTNKLPRVELEEIGPSFDLKVDRFKFASDSLWKQATKVSTLGKVIIS